MCSNVDMPIEKIPDEDKYDPKNYLFIKSSEEINTFRSLKEILGSSDRSPPQNLELHPIQLLQENKEPYSLQIFHKNIDKKIIKIDKQKNLPYEDYFKPLKNNHTPLLEELLGDHTAFVDFMQKQVFAAPVLRRTQYSALSAEFAQRIAGMDFNISAAEMNSTLATLRMGPLLVAATTLGEILVDMQRQPNKNVRDKVDNLLARYKGTVSFDTDIGRLLAKDIPQANYVEIFNPSDDVSVLNRMLVRGGACTASFSPNLTNSPAQVLMEDSKAGGSIHFQFGAGLSNSYNRLYVAIDSNGSPFLFYDAIESGNLGRTTVNSYVSDGIPNVLLGSYAASVIIANRMGVDKLSFGDLELVDVSRHLGFSEVKLFGDEDNGNQKLGYVGSALHTSGPYMWMMQRDKTFRSVNPSLYNNDSVMQVIQQGYDVMKRVETNTKSLKTLGKDYEAYFTALEGIVLESKSILGEEGFQQVSADIASFLEKYKIKTGGVLSAYIPEPLVVNKNIPRYSVA